jgi:hypothetical protein
MPYCVDCGGYYDGSERFCNSCGQQLKKTQHYTDTQLAYSTSSPGSSASATIASKVIVDALREGRVEEREERRKSRNYNRAMQDSDDSLELFLKCVAILGIFHGMSLIGANWWPVLNGPIGYFLVGGAFLSAFVKIIIDVRHGHPFGKSLLVVTLLGLLIYGMEYGIFWYIKDQVMAHPETWFQFKLPTPTPTPLLK